MKLLNLYPATLNKRFTGFGSAGMAAVYFGKLKTDWPVACLKTGWRAGRYSVLLS
jgi:hypothetical protein